MDLLCWGSGVLGQSGQGRPNDKSPEEGHLTEFTSTRLGQVKLMACGSSHSIVVTVDNKIFAWGNGTSGQLGNGEGNVRDWATEVKLPHPNYPDEDSVVGVACGSRHSFIWTQSRHVYSFGNNYYAQLGYDYQRADFKENQMAPRLFQSLPSSATRIFQVACGERHTLFALEDGTVAACGLFPSGVTRVIHLPPNVLDVDLAKVLHQMPFRTQPSPFIHALIRNKKQNDYGQLGSGLIENATVPHFVEGLDHVSKIICGANHNLALTADGRLYQWGCGKACGNFQGNLMSPEEVILASTGVKDIAGGAWHSLLLTDGGEVCSWGMGQEGQLGLGESRVHVSTPCFLSYSLLSQVTQLQAGDSYSAAVTGGKLLLWGQIPSVSWVSDHSGPKRLWTPQPASLADRKVYNVACGAWHMMALTTNKSGEWAHSTQPVSDPLPMQNTKKESRVQNLRLARPKLPHDPTQPESLRERDCEIRQEERSKQNREDLTFHDPAFSVTSFTRGKDRTAKGSSSAKSTQQQGRKGTQQGTRHESREVVLTTIQLLPRRDCRRNPNTLARLVTGHQSQSNSLPKLQEFPQSRSPPLCDFVQESGTNPCIIQSQTKTETSGEKSKSWVTNHNF